MDANKESAAPMGTVLTTTAFGTTVGMWAVAYVCHLPGVAVSGWFAVPLLALCLAAGGYAGGRHTARPMLSGCIIGLADSTLNFLILGSLLGGGEPNRLREAAMWWIPGMFAAGGALGALGGFAAGTRPETRRRDALEWTGAMAKITAVAGFMMITAGGLVTSYGAGLSVADWPRTFGYEMFLFPLSKMTGGIYFEHAHRLFGTLVGLCAIALTVMVWRHDRGKGLRAVMLLILVLVVCQGIMGGLRVTGRFTLSASPGVMRPNIALAVVHGVTAQCLFAALVAVAGFTSAARRRKAAPVSSPAAATDRVLNIACIILVVAQIVLGALLRHLGTGIFIHIAGAVFVLILCVACGIRAWGMHGRIAPLRRLGLAVAFLAALQFALGFGAFITTGAYYEKQNAFLTEVVFTTAHQTAGALVLSAVVLLTLYNFLFISQE